MNIKIFCDLDGVLVDFDSGVKKILKKSPDQLPEGLMWAVIKKTPDFYNKLDWMPDGKELWNFIKDFQGVQLLTGVPRGSSGAGGAVNQKNSWCRRELGTKYNVICCSTKDKPLYATKGAILIDDRLKIADEWIAKGGIFIHHTNTENTIKELQKYIFSFQGEEAEGKAEEINNNEYEYIVPTLREKVNKK